MTSAGSIFQSFTADVRPLRGLPRDASQSDRLGQKTVEAEDLPELSAFEAESKTGWVARHAMVDSGRKSWF